MKKFVNHCLDRLTWGGSVPTEINAFNALGGNNDARLQAFVNQQLDWSSIDDSAFDNKIATLGYETLDKSLTELWYDYHAYSSAVGFDRNRPAEEMERYCVARALHSKRQLLEVLADFWHNHFNVYDRDYYAQSVWVSWDRDVIRPPVAGHPREPGFAHGHMLGNFRQMLELTSRHAAMQYYLDNYINSNQGPNENYAREVMELHTLGAENYSSLGDPLTVPKTEIPLPWGAGGSDILVPIADQYVDDDVYAAMRMLTGWKLKDRADKDYADESDTGEFFFWPAWHDQFEKTILGHRWPTFHASPVDIEQFFDILAYHPGTARHIAGKLCRKFIGYEPPSSLVDTVADVFYQNRYASDQLELTCRAIFSSAEFTDPANFGNLLKRPMEVMISALRVLKTDYWPARNDEFSWNVIHYFMDRAGQMPFHWRSPDGFPDNEDYWLGSTTMLYQLRFFDWACDKRDSNENYISPILSITEAVSTNALPSYSPSDLTRFWANRILGHTPAGGWESTELYAHLLEFMRQTPVDATQWPADVPFPDLNAGWPHYPHARLRGLVKLLLSTSDFLHR